MFWLCMLGLGVIFWVFKIVGLIIESYRIYKFRRGTYNWDNNWDKW